MIIKIIGGLFITAAGFLIGNTFSKKLSRRRDFLKTFQVFLSTLSTNLRYSGADIFSVVKLSAQSANFSEFDLTEYNKPFEDVWHKKVEEIPNCISLNDSDKELLLEFGSHLGKTDTEGQLRHIELYQTLFERQLKSAETEVSDKSRLYRTIGLFSGISAALMII